jgi:hypothetical protein
MNAIVPHGHDFRSSTDAAGLCGAIVKQTARNIQGRKYVSVEGWQAIAIAHGCAASALEVERVPDEGMSGFKCVGIVRRMDDGQEIARAEGFLGDDENTWNKRPVYARRAMVQTRAISRACRSAFAHVVVMIDAGLSTTPAEEVPEGGFVEGQFREGEVSPREPAVQADDKPKRVKLEGPYTSKTTLWQAFKAFDRELRGCGDSDEFEILLTTADAKALIEQCERDAPQLIDGGEDMPAEFLPLNMLIEQRRHDFKQLETAEQMAGFART